MNRIAKLLIVAVCMASTCPLFGGYSHVNESEWAGGYSGYGYYDEGYVIKANGLYWCCKDYGDGVMVTGFDISDYNDKSYMLDRELILNEKFNELTEVLL